MWRKENEGGREREREREKKEKKKIDKFWNKSRRDGVSR
jgi:hypothetical protein